MNTVDLLGDEEVCRQYLEGSLSEIVDDQLTYIKSSAFAYFSSLREVTFPKANFAQSTAFYHCENLELFSCNSSGLRAYKETFGHCYKLSNINGKILLTGEYGIFEYCSSLTSINVELISNSIYLTFSGCLNLSSINYNETNENLEVITYYAFGNCYKLKSYPFPNLNTISGNGMACCGIENANFSNLLDLKNSGFYRCYNLSMASFPKLSILQNAFPMCNKLQYLFLSDVTSFSDRAFSDTFCLKTVVLNGSSIPSIYSNSMERLFASFAPTTDIKYYVPNSMLSIYHADSVWGSWSGSIFSIGDIPNWSSYEYVYVSDILSYSIKLGDIRLREINDSVATEINTYLAMQPNLISISLPNVTSIYGSYYKLPSHCFDLEYVNLEKLTTVPSSCFSECINLKSVNIASAVTINPCAFMDCVNLSSIVLSKIFNISTSAFQNTALETFIYSISTIYNIHYSAFKNCYKLREVDIKVSSIFEQAFHGCKNLKKVTFRGSVRYLSRNVFQDCEKLEILVLNTNSMLSFYNPGTYDYGFDPLASSTLLSVFVPNSMLSTYRNHSSWVSMSSRIFSFGDIPSE